MEKEFDVVTNPAHYRHKSGIEAKEIIYDLPAWLSSAIKYVWRYQFKGKPVEDLRKAKECLTAFTTERMATVSILVNFDTEYTTKVHKVIDAEDSSLLGEVLYIMILKASETDGADVAYLLDKIDDQIERLLEEYEGEMR